jgi:hypothetical protein
MRLFPHVAAKGGLQKPRKNGLSADSLGRYFVVVSPQGSTPEAVYAYSIHNSLPARTEVAA